MPQVQGSRFAFKVHSSRFVVCRTFLPVDETFCHFVLDTTFTFFVFRLLISTEYFYSFGAAFIGFIVAAT